MVDSKSIHDIKECFQKSESEKHEFIKNLNVFTNSEFNKLSSRLSKFNMVSIIEIWLKQFKHEFLEDEKEKLLYEIFLEANSKKIDNISIKQKIKK